MKRLRLGVVAIVLAGLSLAAGGCCDKEKQTIAALERDRNDLAKQLQDVRMQMAESTDQGRQYQAQFGAKDAEIARLNRELAEARKSGTEGDWEKGRTADRVTLGSDILFSSGKADLTAAGKTKLDKIASDLKTRYAGMPVLVYGYTDTDPIRVTKNLWADNLDLSANRAMAVTRYLIGKGLRADDIETVAMGQTHQVPGDKAKSRRVEIIVLKTGATVGG